jgi:hypothetical protein
VLDLHRVFGSNWEIREIKMDEELKVCIGYACGAVKDLVDIISLLTIEEFDQTDELLASAKDKVGELENHITTIEHLMARGKI